MECVKNINMAKVLNQHKNFCYRVLLEFGNTVKLRYLELRGAVEKLQDIRVFEISRVKYLKNRWLGLKNHFDISMFMRYMCIGVRDIKVQLYFFLDFCPIPSSNSALFFMKLSSFLQQPHNTRSIRTHCKREHNAEKRNSSYQT